MRFALGSSTETVSSFMVSRPRPTRMLQGAINLMPTLGVLRDRGYAVAYW